MIVTADPVLATPDDEREAGGAPVDLAVVFTDLEGFTAFTAAEGDDAAARLLLTPYRHAFHGLLELKRRPDSRTAQRQRPGGESARATC